MGLGEKLSLSNERVLYRQLLVVTSFKILTLLKTTNLNFRFDIRM